MEIPVLVARGLSNDRIAQQLHLAPATVERHLANVYERAVVRSRTEAVRMALIEQWIGFTQITEAVPSTDGYERYGTPGA